MRRGFTLIELLIVIALLGTLAVALLAAIDPFEQFRKGTDTGTRNTTQEIFNAAIRYYALRRAWPTGWYAVGPNATPIEGIGSDLIIQPLIDAGELKDNFIELAGDDLNNIYLSKKTADTITDSHIAVCYEPQSKSFKQADSNTKFSSPNYSAATDYNGPETTNTAECQLNGGDLDCYWCIY